MEASVAFAPLPVSDGTMLSKSPPDSSVRTTDGEPTRLEEFGPPTLGEITDGTAWALGEMAAGRAVLVQRRSVSTSSVWCSRCA